IAWMKGKINVRDHETGSGVKSSPQIVDIETVTIRRLVCDKLVPTTQPDARVPRHLNQSAHAIQGKAWLDRDLHVFRGSATRRERPSHHPQTGDGAAALEEKQRARELAAVIGLFVAEIIRPQQFAGGVVKAIGFDIRFEERVE